MASGKHSGWEAEFDGPVMARGRALVTLRDADDYATRLSKAEQKLGSWTVAIAALLKAAQHGEPFVLIARAAMLKALAASEELRAVASPDRPARKNARPTATRRKPRPRYRTLP